MFNFLNRSPLPTLTLTLTLTLILLTPGCSVWTDFTTYFNLYYNTLDLFEQAEIAIDEQRKDPYVLFEPNIPPSANQNLNKVIEKCSKILQFNNESSFVDEALLIIGKSFYYQKNYLKALRKFQELSATQTESELLLENNLWTAMTQIQLKDYEKGLALLRDVRARAEKEDENKIVVKSYIAEIRYLMQNERWDESIKLARLLIKVSDDENVNAVTAFQIAELHSKLEQLEESSLAYAEVSNYSPDYELAFKSQLKYGKSLRQLNREEDALVVFKSLRSEDKYSNTFDLVELELGITFKKMDRFNEAYYQFYLIDTGYVNSTILGDANYEMAEMFEVDLKNYDSASVYYKNALASPSTAEYLPLIRQKSTLFNKYLDLNSNILKTQKYLDYAANPDLFVQDSLDYILKDSLYKKQLEENQPQQQNLEGGDEGNLRNPNITTTTTNQTQNRSPQPIPPVKSNLNSDSLTTLLIKYKFELGNLFFTELHLLDSAYFYYNNILEMNVANRYEGSILFALASYYETIEDKGKADSLFKVVYDNFKNENIVNAAAAKLNLPMIDFNYDPASELFSFAEIELLEKNYSFALTELYKIPVLYPNSEFAPKSLYTAGFTLENYLSQLDSAAVVYDSLIAKYPRSQFASKVNPKVSFYKSEKARLKKAAEDSIAAINQKAIQDSIDAIQKEEIKSEEDTKSKIELIEEEKKDEEENPNLKSEIDKEKDKDKEKDEGKEEEEEIPQGILSNLHGNRNYFLESSSMLT